VLLLIKNILNILENVSFKYILNILYLKMLVLNLYES